MASGDPAYTAPYATVSSTDRGGALLTVNTIGLTITVFSVALRVLISNKETELGLAVYRDDILCFAATVSCLRASPPPAFWLEMC